jgi:hypothetical protein
VEDQMNKKIAPPKEPAPQDAARPVEKDLSRDIEKAVERQPLDTVRCVRVFGNYYRCNWWCRMDGARKGLDYDWGGIATDCIRTSRFLTATMNAGELVIQEAGVN